jgi:hypothetical protein
VKDFTHLNFLHMVPRLHVLIRAASVFSKGTDPRAQAMGYSHSYLDPENARIESLASFPTDGEVVLAVGEAWEEATSLLGLLGVPTDYLPGSSTTNVVDATPIPPHADHVDSASGVDPAEESGAITIQHLSTFQQSADWETVDSHLKEEMHMLTCAAVALEIEERKTL